MEKEDYKRKLVAILSADVKGYSRLMGEDEVKTVQTLTNYREAMTSLIHEHRGRLVDSPGDNLLAEFASVVDAVRCAVQVQEHIDPVQVPYPYLRLLCHEARVRLHAAERDHYLARQALPVAVAYAQEVQEVVLRDRLAPRGDHGALVAVAAYQV